MADALTKEEEHFLAELKKILSPDEQNPGAINTRLYKAVETRLKAADNSGVKDVFAALQSEIDAYTGELDKQIAANNDVAKELKRQLSTPVGMEARTKDYPIAGSDEILAKSKALTELITNGKIQAIMDAAEDAELPAVKGESFTLKGNYTSNVPNTNETRYVTVVHHKQLAERVTGEGHIGKTERSTQQGKPTKAGAFKNQANVKSGTPLETYIVPPDIFKDDNTSWMTADDLAESMVHVIPKGGIDLDEVVKDGVVVFPARHIDPPKSKKEYSADIAIVRDWLVHATPMKDAQGHFCDNTKFTYPVVHAGDAIPKPHGIGEIAPRQSFMICTTCTVTNPADEPLIESGITVTVQYEPKKPQTPPKKNEEPVLDVNYSTARPSAPSEKRYINPYTTGWYAELYAMTNKDVAVGYYDVENVMANKRAKGEKQSGETEYAMQGKNRGRNDLSKEDDETAEKKFGLNGAGRATADKVRAFSNGYIVDTDGLRMKRSDKTQLEFVSGGYYATTDLGVTLNYGKVHPIPVPSIYKPSEQLSLFSHTDRYGLTEVRFAMAEVNLGGKDNRQAAQRSWISNPMAANVIRDGMFVDADNKHIEKYLDIIDGETDPAKKKEAAIEVLKAVRDLKNNPSVRAADALTHSAIEHNEKAIEDYLTRKGVKDVAALKVEVQDVSKYDYVLPEIMPAADRKYVTDHGVRDNALSGMDLPPEKIKELYHAAAVQTFQTQNAIEHEVGLGGATELKEPQAITTMRETWKALLRKEDGSINETSVKAYAALLKREDQQANVELAQGLSDLLKNPQDYNMSRKDAEQFVQQLCGDSDDGKTAFEDVSRLGRTPRIPGVHSKALPGTRVDIIGRAVGKTAEEHPEMFVKLVETLSSEQQGKSDGRPHAIAMLHELGAEHVSGGPKNIDPPALGAMLASLNDKDRAELLRHNMRDIMAYVDSGAAGFSVTAQQQVDNITLMAMKRFEAGQDVDLHDLFKELTATDSRKQFLAESLKTRPAFAAQEMLKTIIKHPEICDELEKGLSKLGDGIPDGLENYDRLRRGIKHAHRLIDEYHATGDMEKLKEAVGEYSGFFIRLESQAASKRARKNIEADQRGNAWDGLMTIVGESPKLSGVLLSTIESEPAAMEAFLQGVPNTGYITNMKHGHFPGHVSKQATMKDAYYDETLYTLPLDKDGNVTRGNLFHRKSATVNEEGLRRFVNAGTDTTPPATVADQLNDKSKNEVDKIAQSFKTAHVLGLDPTIYLGKSEANLSADALQPLKVNALKEQLHERIEKGHAVKADGSAYTEQDITATAEFASKFVKTITKAGDLFGELDQKALQKEFQELSKSNSQRGFDRKLLLFLLPLAHTTNAVTVPVTPPGGELPGQPYPFPH